MNKLALIGCLVAVSACGDDGGSTTIDAPGTSDGPIAVDAPVDVSVPAGVFGFNGIVGTDAPATGNTVVIWVVSSGSPDYIYKFGQGTSTGAQFVVSFSTNPPAAALNSYGIGVGIVALLAPGTAVPADGMVDEMVLDGAGYTPLHAVIYKDATANPAVVPWIAPFPLGYSCGRCVEASAGFDSFEPTACTTVEVDMTPANACNWT